MKNLILIFVIVILSVVHDHVYAIHHTDRVRQRRGKSSTPKIRSILDRLISGMVQAQEAEDKAFENVKRECNVTQETSDETIMKMKNALPDREKFAKRKAHEFVGADTLLREARQALGKMQAEPINEEAQEALASVFLEKDAVEEAEKNVKGEGLDVDTSGLSSVEISLKEARDEATLADEWRSHEEDVLKSSEELRDELRQKCDALREKYEENRKSRDKQIMSVRTTIESLETVPNVQELLRSISPSSSSSSSRFKQSQEDDGDSISIVPTNMRFRRDDNIVAAEENNEEEEETTSIELRNKAQKHLQELEEKTAKQAAESAERFKKMEEERNEQIGLAQKREKDRAEAEVAIKSARENAKKGVIEARKNLNDAQDILLKKQKKCDVATSEAEQAEGEWSVASSARVALEKQLKSVHDEASGVGHGTVADAEGKQAGATSLATAAMDSAEEMEKAAEADRKAIESQEKLIETLEKSDDKEALQTAKTSLNAMKTSLEIHLRGAEAASNTAEKRAQDELRSREHLAASQAQSSSMSESFSTKIKSIENQLEESRRIENVKRGKKTQADAAKTKTCSVSSAQKTRVDMLEHKLIQAEARSLQREEQYEAFSQGKALSDLPTPKPLVLHPCGLYTSCVDCTENPSCGWEVKGKSGKCVIGTSHGPLIVTEKSNDGYYYQTCPGDVACDTISDCHQCLSYKKCGYCAATLMCTEGNSLGPAVNEMCSAQFLPTWLHKARGAGISSCAPRGVELTDQAVAQDAARRRYIFVSEKLQTKQNELYDMLKANSNETDNDDDIDIKTLTKEIGPIRRRWNEAKQDLLDAVSGMSRTFYAGFEKGLEAGEKRAAQNAGYLQGVRKVLELLKSGNSDVGITLGDKESANLKLLAAQIAKSGSTPFAGGDNADALNAATEAKKVSDELAEEASKLGDSSQLMRLAVQDAEMSSSAGLLTAAESTKQNAGEVVDEMESLTKRVNEIRERLKSGHGISEEEANIIASKYNGGNDHRVVTSTSSSDNDGKIDLEEQLRGQVPLPGPGENSKMFSPLAKNAKKYSSGASKNVAAIETNRDIDPMSINGMNAATPRFESTNVQILDSNPVDATSRALESVLNEKIDLENQFRAASEKASNASSHANELEIIQKDASMELERLNVKFQLLQDEFEEKRFDREKAVRNNLDTLDDAEIAVERAGEELEAMTLEVEKQKRVVDGALDKAQTARQEANRLDLVSERLSDALSKATEAYEALSGAAEGVSRFASAREVTRRINV